MGRVGLVDLYNCAGEPSYLSTARTVASSAMRLLVNAGVIVEPCESLAGGCGSDGPQFKGIFVRYLSYLYNSLTVISLSNFEILTADMQNFLSTFRSFIATQASSIWNSDRDITRDTLGLHWAGPYLNEREYSDAPSF